MKHAVNSILSFKILKQCSKVIVLNKYQSCNCYSVSKAWNLCHGILEEKFKSSTGIVKGLNVAS